MMPTGATGSPNGGFELYQSRHMSIDSDEAVTRQHLAHRGLSRAKHSSRRPIMLVDMSKAPPRQPFVEVNQDEIIEWPEPVLGNGRRGDDAENEKIVDEASAAECNSNAARSMSTSTGAHHALLPYDARLFGRKGYTSPSFGHARSKRVSPSSDAGGGEESVGNTRVSSPNSVMDCINEFTGRPLDSHIPRDSSVPYHKQSSLRSLRSGFNLDMNGRASPSLVSLPLNDLAACSFVSTLRSDTSLAKVHSTLNEDLSVQSLHRAHQGIGRGNSLRPRPPSPVMMSAQLPRNTLGASTFGGPRLATREPASPKIEASHFGRKNAARGGHVHFERTPKKRCNAANLDHTTAVINMRARCPTDQSVCGWLDSLRS